MQESTGHGTPAGNTYPQVLGKRWERDWEQQPAGVNPACAAARKETQQASVVSAIQPAAGGLSTGAPGESSSSVQCSGAQGGACSPAKKRIRFRASLPGHSLQEFRLFLKHEPPFKAAADARMRQRKQRRPLDLAALRTRKDQTPEPAPLFGCLYNPLFNYVRRFSV
ncbi:hypothetical protein OEZ85_011758 [Tetradesmus obliquus]|uniref:Uncharacterized protein n=1 Tax=Tetradesmus obliquus TaxID=3088 RepID=A0ABY8TTM0_TETOB|nr:hypothetical protein OEZ85_011758 [Tetradesmus obliquus]